MLPYRAVNFRMGLNNPNRVSGYIALSLNKDCMEMTLAIVKASTSKILALLFKRQSPKAKTVHGTICILKLQTPKPTVPKPETPHVYTHTYIHLIWTLHTLYTLTIALIARLSIHYFDRTAYCCNTNRLALTICTRFLPVKFQHVPCTPNGFEGMQAICGWGGVKGLEIGAISKRLEFQA